MRLDAFTVLMVICAVMMIAGCFINVRRNEMTVRDALTIAVPGSVAPLLLIVAYERHIGYLFGIAILLLFFLWPRILRRIENRLARHNTKTV